MPLLATGLRRAALAARSSPPTCTLALARPLVRGLAAAPPRPQLTLEQAMTSSHLILNELKSTAAIQQLKAAQQQDKLGKWQQANAVLIQATLRVLPQVGFPANPAGLQGYTEAFAQQARSDQPEARTVLKQLNDSKWRILLEHAFECEPAAPLSLSAARALAIDMVDAMQDEEFGKQVEESRSGLAARLPEAERQHMVARAVVGVQSEVVARHGFPGDAGYAQAQVCLMEHAHDAVVTASVAAATTQLYSRAGIDLGAALRQLSGGGGA